MTIKWLEIRDRGTTIPALALRISERDGWLAERAGYGEVGCVLLINLARPECQRNIFDWDARRGRTMRIAHLYLQINWQDIRDGQLIDVEYILQETDAPKTSEQPTC